MLPYSISIYKFNTDLTNNTDYLRSNSIFTHFEDIFNVITNQMIRWRLIFAIQCKSIKKIQLFYFCKKEIKILKYFQKKKKILLILIPKLKDSNKNALILTYGKYT